MKEYSAGNMIDRARVICKYEPEFNYNPENGMLQIWDYSEENGQSFHREDYCRANLIDLDELFKLINENHFSFVTSLYEAYNYIYIPPDFEDEKDEI